MVHTHHVLQFPDSGGYRAGLSSGPKFHGEPAGLLRQAPHVAQHRLPIPDAEDKEMWMKAALMNFLVTPGAELGSELAQWACQEYSNDTVRRRIARFSVSTSK